VKQILQNKSNMKRGVKHTSVKTEGKVALRDMQLDRKTKPLDIWELKKLGGEYEQERRGNVKQRINFHDL
jgi:hypothetical protein